MSKFATSLVSNISAKILLSDGLKIRATEVLKTDRKQGVKVSSVPHCILVEKFSNLNRS